MGNHKETRNQLYLVPINSNFQLGDLNNHIFVFVMGTTYFATYFDSNTTTRREEA